MDDMKTLVRPEGAIPLLFRTAAPRTSGPSIPGEYDDAAALWVVGESRLPIVSAAAADLLEVTTKTRVRQEADDDEAAALSLAGESRRLNATAGQAADILEVTTKTKVRQEADDEDSRLFPTESAGLRELLELQTKTFVVQESDDDIASALHLLELETKTQAEVEHDDQTHLAL